MIIYPYVLAFLAKKSCIGQKVLKVNPFYIKTNIFFCKFVFTVHVDLVHAHYTY